MCFGILELSLDVVDAINTWFDRDISKEENDYLVCSMLTAILGGFTLYLAYLSVVYMGKMDNKSRNKVKGLNGPTKAKYARITSIVSLVFGVVFLVIELAKYIEIISS